MDKEEARELLSIELEQLAREPSRRLQRLLKDVLILERTGKSGKNYQLEFQAVWDDPEKLTLRVIGSIDDGRFLSALAPITESFIVVQ